MNNRIRKRRLYRGIIEQALESFPRVEHFTSWITGKPAALRFTVYQSLRSWADALRTAAHTSKTRRKQQ